LFGGESDDTSASKTKRKRSSDDSEVEGIVAQLDSKFASDEMLSRHQRSPAGINWMKLLGLGNLPDLREAVKFKVKQGGKEKTLDWEDIKKFIKKRKLKIELQK